MAHLGRAAILAGLVAAVAATGAAAAPREHPARVSLEGYCTVDGCERLRVLAGDRTVRQRGLVGRSVALTFRRARLTGPDRNGDGVATRRDLENGDRLRIEGLRSRGGRTITVREAVNAGPWLRLDALDE